MNTRTGLPKLKLTTGGAEVMDLLPSECDPGEFCFEPVRPPTLREKVATQIRAAILTGDLLPGSCIVQSKLSKQMKVAQTTVREALQDLAGQGIVVNRVNRETLVRRLTLADVEKIFYLRLELEGLAVELCHSKMNDEALSVLYGIVEQMCYCARKQDIPKFYQFDFEFHTKLWGLSGNEFLEAALRPLLVGPVAFVLVGSPFPLKGNYLQVANGHADILNVLREGTKKEAREMLETQLRRWHELQMKNLESGS